MKTISPLQIIAAARHTGAVVAFAESGDTATAALTDYGDEIRWQIRRDGIGGAVVVAASGVISAAIPGGHQAAMWKAALALAAWLSRHGFGRAN